MINTIVALASASINQLNPPSGADTDTGIKPLTSSLTAGVPLVTESLDDPKKLWLKALENLKVKEPSLVSYLYK